MGRLIREIGDCKLEPETRRFPVSNPSSRPFRAPAAQRHGGKHDPHPCFQKAVFPAASFHGRRTSRVSPMNRSAPWPDFPTRRSGPSVTSPKKTLSGVVPTSRQDREIVRHRNHRAPHRGPRVSAAGRWRCFLIFQLGRTDVLPVDDFGGPRRLSARPIKKRENAPHQSSS